MVSGTERRRRGMVGILGGMDFRMERSIEPAQHSSARRPLAEPGRVTFWREFWRPRGPALRSLAVGNERVLARLRIFLPLVIAALYAPIAFASEDLPPLAVGLSFALLLLIVAQASLVLLRLRHGTVSPVFLLTGSLLNVTVVSGILLVFLLTDQPNVTVNSRVVFCGYFLVIAASGLHYQTRAALITGLTAIVQYALLVMLVVKLVPQSSYLAPRGYGNLIWADQVGRLILLAGATVIAALAVHRSRLAEAWSTRDALTGLHNRAYLDERLYQETLRQKRTQQPLTFAMIDLDSLKTFNDGFGHPAGDRALQLAATVIQEAFRTNDVVARYGGDEIAVVLPDLPLEGALERLSLLSRELEEYARREDLREIPTLSIGAAEIPRDAQEVDELVAHADRRLYLAKELGRNQVVTEG